VSAGNLSEYALESSRVSGAGGCSENTSGAKCPIQGSRGTGFAGPQGASPLEAPRSGALQRGEAASAAQGGDPNIAQGGVL